MNPFYALIVPMYGPGIPAHPIAPGGPNPPVDPGYGYPQYPVDPGYGVPGPPYGKPPGIWGGGNEPFPTPPIVIPPDKPGDKPGLWPHPGRPVHPIVLPPEPELPPNWPDPPGKPPGGDTGTPENPINLPPGAVASTHGFWALCYFKEMGGWLWAWVPVEVEKPAKR